MVDKTTDGEKSKLQSLQSIPSVFRKLVDKVKSMEDRILKLENINICILFEKIKPFEQRLVTVETEQAKDYVLKKPFDEQTISLNNTYNVFEEWISSNKDSIVKLELDLENLKTIKLDESAKANKNKVNRCKWWNRGFCKYKKDCPDLHPQEICSEGQCESKECEKRHPNTCKNWKKGFCKFLEQCEFSHPILETQVKVDSEQIMGEAIVIDDNYVDYDNLDSDDDDTDDNREIKFNCDQCEYTCKMESNLTKHVKSDHNHSCEQCKFKTSNSMHLKMHVKSCHKKNELNEVNLTKKRKSTEVIPLSRKKTKNNVVSKKVKKGKC